MLPITLTNLDQQTNHWLRQEAQRRGTTPDQLIIELLHQAMQKNVPPPEAETIYHDLDALAGTWTEAEAEAFLQTVADFERIDQALWE